MKKIIIVLLGAFVLSSCGVGSYSVSSGKADEGMISFVSESKTPITVTIDNESHDVYTVKTKAWRKDRNIKKKNIKLSSYEKITPFNIGRSIAFLMWHD